MGQGIALVFLYVTERINNYHKIGIANDLQNRLNTFRTIVPDLNFSFYIPLPNRKCGELIESSLKSHLMVYRYEKSECYGLEIDSIKKVIKGYSLLLNYCIIDYGVDPINHLYKSQFDESRPAWSNASHESTVIFLNEIYFGEKIPLFQIIKTSKDRIKIKVLNKVNSIKELAKMTFKLEGVLKGYEVSLKNSLYGYLKEYDNKEIKLKQYTKNIMNYFSPIVWEALTKHIQSLKEIYSNKKIVSINKNKSHIYYDFPYNCLLGALINKKNNAIFTNSELFKNKKIPGRYRIDQSQLKPLESLFGKPK